ncbi:hypothetical protein PFLmoz3_05232 [Pseudomonas fluorescens]|uniref:Uncharacterized protein n=1 Tax=Pseudomonas fluorescens TaxID=294 RepID=A0A125QHQ9_PSEFL|nr:hypothetical protein PFLmoz3_05232 [Pseudomonas fluorescens]
MGIEFPTFYPRICIDGSNAIVGCASEQRIFNLQWGVRIHGALVQLDLRAGTIRPGHFQVLNVITVDLRKGRVARTRSGSAICGPI